MIIFYMALLSYHTRVIVGSQEGDVNCPRGRCDDGRCPQSEDERCPEDGCGYHKRRCNETLLCIFESRSCPGEPCTKSEKTCADGSCIPVYEDSCPDGSDPCWRTEKRCNSGTCVDRTIRCFEDPCTEILPYKCGAQCRSMHIICDGYVNCPSGEDELGCDEGPSKLWYLLILLIIPLGCCGCCCYYCYKGWQEADEEEKANQRTAMTSVTQVPNSTQGPHIAETVVISNAHGGPQVTYQPTETDSYPSHTSNTPAEPLLPAMSPITFNDHQPSVAPSAPTAPPGYSDVMSNQHMYPPPSGNFEKSGIL